jgi:hypothetical protein
MEGMVHRAGTPKMPLTSFQAEVLAILRNHRAEVSHFAGGIVLNAASGSARYSHDFDLFHDAVSDLVKHNEADIAALEEAGFHVEKTKNSGSGPKRIPSEKPKLAEDRKLSIWIGLTIRHTDSSPSSKTPKWDGGSTSLTWPSTRPSP